MTTEVHHTVSPAEMRRKVDEAIRRARSTDWHKYVGRVKFEKDALALQKELRGEWDERPG
jgi:hypothetical protein